jgi:hypothetical protein
MRVLTLRDDFLVLSRIVGRFGVESCTNARGSIMRCKSFVKNRDILGGTPVFRLNASADQNAIRLPGRRRNARRLSGEIFHRLA